MSDPEALSSPEQDQQPEAAKPQRDGFSLEASQEEIAQAESPEAKLQLTIDLMEKSIAQAGAPHFKGFWELRKVAMELFKETINPILRSQLWTRYTELTKEARRLKEILDEQSAFAVEQIEIAIKALEDELASFDDRLNTAGSVDFGAKSITLDSRNAYYSNTQKELALLNAEASRINALRKELIKTEMRVRQKNKFFQRLSAAGDRVFPRRKDLIKELSENFTNDVEAFMKQHFSGSDISESLFFLREEIKALQTIAKVLTLNTRSFTQTRTRLSEGWDKVKQSEKDRKKERVKMKAVFKQNAEAIHQKLAALTQEFGEGTLSVDAANKKLEEINTEIRNTELGRDELQELRSQLQEAGKPVRERLKEREAESRREELEREKARRAKITALQERVDQLLNNPSSFTAEQIEAERDAIMSDASGKDISRSEKQDLERRLKPIRDILADKKAEALMHLSKDDQEALNQLRDVLKERHVLRQEIKAQLEHYRKALGGSSLDFVQAMQFNEQQKLEKERLEKAEQAIREIEDKIAELEAGA